MELKDGTHRKAKWVIRHYREISEAVSKIEKRRPKLIKRLKYDVATGEILPVELQRMPKVVSDQKVVTTYIEGQTAIEIVRTVLSERLRKSDADIMNDVCVNGMAVTEAMENNGVSEPTVKRARLRMEKAYDAEVVIREMATKSKITAVKHNPEK